jgi:hypothetical protein
LITGRNGAFNLDVIFADEANERESVKYIWFFDFCEINTFSIKYWSGKLKI